MGKKHNWNEEEINTLKEIFNINYSKEQILDKINRSWNSIISKAYQLKLLRPNISKCNTKWILEETLLAYYWVGFILADGHISKNNCLSFHLSIKDIDHLQKIANLLKCPIGISNDSCALYVQDRINFKKLKDKFNIDNRKTYNPPNENIIPNNELGLAMLIGFIDGDGCIRKRMSICILNHKSWYFIHKKFSEIIKNENSVPKIKGDYSIMEISDRSIIRRLYEFVVKNQLPVMSRKWDRCKDMPLTKYEKIIYGEEK